MLFRHVLGVGLLAVGCAVALFGGVYVVDDARSLATLAGMNASRDDAGNIPLIPWWFEDILFLAIAFAPATLGLGVAVAVVGYFLL